MVIVLRCCTPLALLDYCIPSFYHFFCALSCCCRYKTELCRNFSLMGTCVYEQRCVLNCCKRMVNICGCHVELADFLVLVVVHVPPSVLPFFSTPFEGYKHKFLCPKLVGQRQVLNNRTRHRSVGFWCLQGLPSLETCACYCRLFF